MLFRSSLKNYRETKDKKSIDSNTTVTDSPQKKYQLQVEKIRQKNSHLKSLVFEMETKIGIEDLNKKKEFIKTDIKDSKKPLKEMIKSDSVKTLETNLNNTIKQFTDPKSLEDKIMKEVIKKDKIIKELEDELSKKDAMIESLKLQQREEEISAKQINAKVAVQLANLGSIIMRKSASISKGLNCKLSKETLKSCNVHKECLKRLISLKAVARTAFNLTLNFNKVNFHQFIEH